MRAVFPYNFCHGDFEFNALIIRLSFTWSSCSQTTSGSVFDSSTSSALLSPSADELSSPMGSSWSPSLVWTGFCPNTSCFAEVFPWISVAARFEGWMQDGDNSVQRFTEHFCSSSRFTLNISTLLFEVAHLEDKWFALPADQLWKAISLAYGNSTGIMNFRRKVFFDAAFA